MYVFVANCTCGYVGPEREPSQIAAIDRDLHHLDTHHVRIGLPDLYEQELDA